MTEPCDAEPRTTAAGAFGPLAGWMLAGCVALVAAGWVPTARAAGREGIAAMLLACALSTAIALLAGWVSVRRAGAAASELATGILAGQALRLGLTLAAVAVVVFGQLAARKPFVLWVGISYLSLLAVESWMLLRVARAACPAVRRTEGQAC